MKSYDNNTYNIFLCFRFLTVREQKLVERKKNAEDLLKWKKRLDEEEARIYRLEREAMKVWDKKDDGKAPAKDHAKPAREESRLGKHTKG